MPNYNTQADASIDVLRQVRENSNNYQHRQHLKIREYSSSNGKHHEKTLTHA